MRNECNIIRDILPLYAEDMVSPDTADFVREHLHRCPGCRKELDTLAAGTPMPEDTDLSPLKKLQRKLLKKRLLTGLCAILMVVAMAVTAIAALNTPQYFPYTPDLVTVTQEEDGSLLLVFREDVTRLKVYPLPDEQGTDLESVCIEASTSAWDAIFRDKENSGNILRFEEVPDAVFYNANDGTPAAAIYSPPAISTGQSIFLPRLALAYYLIIAAVVLVVCLIAMAVLRRSPRGRLAAQRGALLAASYFAGHLLVMGPRTSTYCLERVFPLILFLTVTIFAVLVLAHSIVGLASEIRQLDR